MATHEPRKGEREGAVSNPEKPSQRILRCNRIVATKLGFTPAELADRDYVDIPFSEFVERADAADIPINLVDNALVYQYVNPVLAHIFGYDDPADIVGQSALFNVTLEEAAPADMMETIRDTGLQSDKMVRRPDGEVRSLSGSYIAVRDEGDTPVEFAGFDEDLTEKKQRQELFERLAEFTYDWIVWLAPDGVILYASPSSERVTGYPAADWVSGAVSWKDVVDAQDIETVRQGVYGGLQRQETGTAEFRLHTRRGEILWMEITSTPVFDKRGDFLGAQVSMHDVTERRELQEKLLTAERLAAVGEAAGSISHELRGPLSVIRSSAFFLEEKMNGHAHDDKVKNHLERIERSVERADRTINDLLAFSRITPLEVKPISLPMLARVAVTEMRLPPEISVRIEAEEGLPDARVDPRQMEQVMHNLITNSFQAMPEGGEVEVSISVAGDGLRLCVSDTGCGISPEDLPKVFDPLFSTKTEGAGFGLPVCQRIIEAHGGTISIESSQGEGTTVTVKVPVCG